MAIILDQIKGSKIEVIDNGEEKTFDLLSIMKIDENDVSASFINQAPIYAYFSSMLAEAEYDSAIASMNVDRKYSMLDLKIREDFQARDEKFTEPRVKALILKNANYISVLSEELDAKHRVKVLKGITSALEQRSEMLISLGAHLRQEMSMTGMKIKQFENDAGSTIKSILSNDKKKK